MTCIAPNTVRLGWTWNDAREEHVPMCDPPHRTALEELVDFTGILRAYRWNVVFIYTWDAAHDSTRIFRERSEGSRDVPSMYHALEPIGRTVRRARERIEQQLAGISPEHVLSDVLRVVTRHRREVRQLLSGATSVENMVDAVARIEVNRGALSERGHFVNFSDDCVTREVAGIPQSRVEWKEGRLHVLIPGIPATHQMAGWTAKESERVDRVRAGLRAIISD